jgi:hypothetical protein
VGLVAGAFGVSRQTQGVDVKFLSFARCLLTRRKTIANRRVVGAVISLRATAARVRAGGGGSRVRDRLGGTKRSRHHLPHDPVNKCDGDFFDRLQDLACRTAFSEQMLFVGIGEVGFAYLAC